MSSAGVSPARRLPHVVLTLFLHSAMMRHRRLLP